MKRALKASAPVQKVRRRARKLSNAGVELTSRWRMLPDFLIVGAQRSGTTSMFKTLIQHPMVARPFLRKGIHYFDVRYDRGESWYRGNFPITATSTLKRRGVRPLTGESSPFYMFHPLAPTRIAHDLPDVRLIVLLRDPVERAYSAHTHESARGFETESFERALDLEDQRIKGERERMLVEEGYESHHWRHNAYLTRGRYIEQLRELEAAVGRDRILVVDSDDFFTTPHEVWPEVCDYLQLSPDADIAFEQHNSRSRSPMDPMLRQKLTDEFQPYDEELAAWWGRLPSWRR